MVSRNTVDGFPPEFTIIAINNYKRRLGSNPEAVRRARADYTSDHKGLSTSQPTAMIPGEVLQMDIAFPHRNTVVNGRTVKQSTYGGSTAYAICMCEATSFIMVKLINTTEALPFV